MLKDLVPESNNVIHLVFNTKKSRYKDFILKYLSLAPDTLRCKKAHISSSHFKITFDTCKPVHVPRSRQTSISKGKKETDGKEKLQNGAESRSGVSFETARVNLLERQLSKLKESKECQTKHGVTLRTRKKKDYDKREKSIVKFEIIAESLVQLLYA